MKLSPPIPDMTEAQELSYYGAAIGQVIAESHDDGNGFRQTNAEFVGMYWNETGIDVTKKALSNIDLVPVASDIDIMGRYNIASVLLKDFRVKQALHFSREKAALTLWNNAKAKARARVHHKPTIANYQNDTVIYPKALDNPGLNKRNEGSVLSFLLGLEVVVVTDPDKEYKGLYSEIDKYTNLIIARDYWAENGIDWDVTPENIFTGSVDMDVMRDHNTEPFLSYTEVDVGNTSITVDSESTVRNTSMRRDATAYLYDDKGVGFFDTATVHTHIYDYMVTVATPGHIMFMWVLSNMHGDIASQIGAGTGNKYIAIKLQALNIRIFDGNGGAITQTTGSGTNHILLTQYYHWLQLDQTVGGSETLTFKLFTDPNRTAQQGSTLVAMLVRSGGTAYRYIQVATSNGGAFNSQFISATTANLDLTGISAQRTRSKFASPVGRKRSGRATGSMMPKMPGTKRGFK